MFLFEFCWLWIFSWIKLLWYYCSIWDKLERLDWLKQYHGEGLSFFNLKGYITQMQSCSLCEGGTCFCVRLILRKFWVFLFMFSTGFILFGFLFLFHQSINVLMFVLSSWCLVLQAFSWLGNCDQVFWLGFYWFSLRFKRNAPFLLYRWW